MSNASSDPIPVAGVRCRMCGAPVVRRPGARGPHPTLCGDECKRAARAAARAAARPRLTPEQRSEQARAASAARWAGHVKHPPTPRVKPSRRVLRACAYCGEVVPMRRDGVQCGREECRRAHKARRMRESGWVRPHRQAERAARRAQPGAVIEKFDPWDVFERDGWVCGICGDPVDPELRWPARMSVSLDHVVPLEMGGDHVPENARCSHLGCNTARGTGVAA